MNVRRRPGFTALIACLALAATALAAVPDVPPTPAAVIDLVSVQTFDLAQPYEHLWRAEKPQVESGYLLVLKVDPDLVYPRQTAEPVLYVGDQTAERINIGHQSGHVIAIVPAVLDDPKDPEFIDLSKALIWFGTPELPERINSKKIDLERQLARRAKIRPMAASALDAARQRGGEAILSFPGKEELLRHAATLVQRYSPQEEQLTDRLR